MPYDLPSNFTGVYDVLKYANTVSGNWLIPLSLVGIIIIVIVTMKRMGYKTFDSLFAGFFFTFFMSSLFWAIGLVSGTIVTILLILWVICGLASFVFDL